MNTTLRFRKARDILLEEHKKVCHDLLILHMDSNLLNPLEKEFVEVSTRFRNITRQIFDLKNIYAEVLKYDE